MNELALIELVDIFQRLQLVHGACGDLIVRGEPHVSDSMYDLAVATTHKAIAMCESAGFNDALKRVKISLFVIDAPRRMDASALANELRNMWETLLFNIAKYRFLQVDSRFIGYVDHPHLFGESVNNAFPSAAPDIREAGNCLAADCNTAAVFHLMRAVEWGLRAFAWDLGLLSIAQRRKKGGTVKYVPLPYSDWEHILAQLQVKVDAKITALRPGNKKQELQEFYYPALQDIRGIRDAWRNHVMHTRREYTSKDAEAILEHVRRLMVTLASRVSEA
jgi:hypothetical protein